MEPLPRHNRGFLKGICIALALCTVLIIGRWGSCEPKPAQLPTNEKEQKVERDKKKSDSIKVVIVYRDSIRTKVITKYRTIRHDSLIPCEEKLIHCDTVLVKDSMAIAERDKKIANDSLVIAGLNDLYDREKWKNMESDSIKFQLRRENTKLKKKLNRTRWFAIAGWGKEVLDQSIPLLR